MDDYHDYSCGIVPCRFDADAIRFLLVWETWGKGHWNFPKGHPEDGEKPIETALRELREETELVPLGLISDEPLVQRYSFRDEGRDRTVHKRVDYFLALVNGGKIQLQTEEVGKSRWATLEELLELTPHLELQQMARDAHDLAVAYQGGA